MDILITYETTKSRAAFLPYTKLCLLICNIKYICFFPVYRGNFKKFTEKKNEKMKIKDMHYSPTRPLRGQDAPLSKSPASQSTPQKQGSGAERASAVRSASSAQDKRLLFKIPKIRTQTRKEPHHLRKANASIPLKTLLNCSRLMTRTCGSTDAAHRRVPELSPGSLRAPCDFLSSLS